MKTSFIWQDTTGCSSSFALPSTQPNTFSHSSSKLTHCGSQPTIAAPQHNDQVPRGPLMQLGSLDNIQECQRNYGSKIEVSPPSRFKQENQKSRYYEKNTPGTDYLNQSLSFSGYQFQQPIYDLSQSFCASNSNKLQRKRTDSWLLSEEKENLQRQKSLNSRKNTEEPLNLTKVDSPIPTSYMPFTNYQTYSPNSPARRQSAHFPKEGVNSPRSSSRNDSNDSRISGRSGKLLFTKSTSVKLFRKKNSIQIGSSDASESFANSVIDSHKRSSFYRQPAEPKLSDFKKGKLLGKGHFGQVYVAQHIQSNFLCAMKIVSKQKIKEEKVDEQIIRQLKLHSLLRHNNIIEQYGFFLDDNNLYIMLELCPGGHVYNLIKKKRRLTESTAACMIKQICMGIEYLHDQKIIHRDIKPENVVISNGVIKICDFGWAVNCASGLRDTRCGTPLYLSPEMVKGEQYDEGVDIWAIGVLTYELIFGSTPFKIWWQGQINKIVDDEVKFPSYVEASDTSKDFILKILEKNPTKRIGVADLLEHPFLRDCEQTASFYEELEF